MVRLRLHRPPSVTPWTERPAGRCRTRRRKGRSRPHRGRVRPAFGSAVKDALAAPSLDDARDAKGSARKRKAQALVWPPLTATL
jgi:hypothetical protein